MFGKEPFSDNSFAGGNSITAKLLSIVSTSVVTLVAVRVFLVNLTVSVTSSITIPRFIRKFFTLLSDTVLVVLSDLAMHLVGLSVVINNTTSIVKRTVTTLTVLVTDTASLFKKIPRTYTVSVTSTVSILRSLFKTLIASAVTSTATIARHLVLGKVLTVVSTSTSTIKKAVRHLLSITSYGIISIGKALSLKFSVVVTSVATIYGGVYPVFGAIADNTFIAISRIRKIFFTKNNG